MNPTDHWTDLKAAGAVPPPSPEVLVHAQRQLAAAAKPRGRATGRRRLVPALAAAGAVAAVAGGIAVQQTSSKQMFGGAPTPTAGSASTAATPTRGSTSTRGLSCALTYSPAALKKGTFAFDGTVLSAAPEARKGNWPTYGVTFAVNEWFGSSATIPTRVFLIMDRAPGDIQLPSEFGPAYQVGSRLLIVGGLYSIAGQTPEPPHVWGCGFSRPYNAADAATWRTILSK